MHSVAGGGLREQAALRPSGLAGARHIFVADKGDYYEICDGLPQFAGSDTPVEVARD